MTAIGGVAASASPASASYTYWHVVWDNGSFERAQMWDSGGYIICEYSGMSVFPDTPLCNEGSAGSIDPIGH